MALGDVSVCVCVGVLSVSVCVCSIHFSPSSQVNSHCIPKTGFKIFRPLLYLSLNLLYSLSLILFLKPMQIFFAKFCLFKANFAYKGG